MHTAAGYDSCCRFPRESPLCILLRSPLCGRSHPWTLGPWRLIRTLWPYELTDTAGALASHLEYIPQESRKWLYMEQAYSYVLDKPEHRSRKIADVIKSLFFENGSSVIWAARGRLVWNGCGAALPTSTQNLTSNTRLSLNVHVSLLVSSFNLISTLISLSLYITY